MAGLCNDRDLARTCLLAGFVGRVLAGLCREGERRPKGEMPPGPPKFNLPANNDIFPPFFFLPELFLKDEVVC